MIKRIGVTEISVWVLNFFFSPLFSSYLAILFPFTVFSLSLFLSIEFVHLTVKSRKEEIKNKITERNSSLHLLIKVQQ
jgi:hypothetical protein